MFKIPEKHIIVNDDAQVRLLEDDGTVYADGDCTPSAGGFILEGFLGPPAILGSALQLLKATTRIITKAYAAGVKEKLSIEVTVDSGASKGDIFMVRIKNPLKTPTEMQQYIPLEKRYQLSSDITAATGSDHTVAAAIVATINADPSSHVTAAVRAGGGNEGVVELTAKEAGVNIEFYVNSNATLALAPVPVVLTYDTGRLADVTTAGAAEINGYDMLKNINWAKNLDFDRNVEYFPIAGAQYTSYYFQVNWTALIGGADVPSEVPSTGRTDFHLWVKAGLTLKTKMDLLVGDVNV